MNERNMLRAVALATIYMSLIVMCARAAAAEPGCAASAQTQRLACQFDVRDDSFRQAAIRLDNAEDAFDEGAEECDDVPGARLDLCESPDDAAHDPELARIMPRL